MKKVAFGVMLRAARLGFAYVEAWNAFIRVSDVEPHFLVELRPNALQYLKGGEGKKHRNMHDPEKVIALSPVLSAIKVVDLPVDLLLDDYGLEVGVGH